MGIDRRDTEHVFERLRSGVVPERGLDAFAVGTSPQQSEIARLLDLARDSEGVFKFLRGGYGCGKTFMARLATLDAQAKGFATSFVVVSDNDLHFHKFEELYRKVVQGLSTSSCPTGALNDVIDRWIGKVEDSLIAAGANENAEDFDDKVQRRIGEEIAAMTGGKAPDDMARVLRTVFALKQRGDVAEAGALISWLSGSGNVAASAKKQAGIKGDIAGADAMKYLQGVLEIVKAAGYAGLVIVIDEAETILRMRRDSRGKSLNGIRQICDEASRFQGLLWLFTGTPEFFDTKRGVAGLQPLHDRVRFLSHEGGRASLRQPQLELRPFDKERLLEVALKLREIYPAKDRSQLEAKVSQGYLSHLVDQVTEGFRGDVGVVPRQFLRQLVDVLDLVNDHDDFNPSAESGFTLKAATEDEKRLVEGKPLFDLEPEDDKGYEPAVMEF
ncbi:MAG: BREX system ATP-binding protein BrxD [Myxococcota bacterium]|jgi:hypothetical protein|nr:BREX system ATP-binding protein BrxD [Myxococcota bacterium]